MKNAENPILSISLLASNRLDTIPRCLDSLTPIREALPCELIIVDTSTDPKVRECLLKYTDLIESFEWCNDFSKARNTGLAKAKGEWFMFIDDDEWFIDSKPLIDFFKNGEYKEYGFAFYKVRNYLQEDFLKYSDAWVKRLTRMTADTCFKSKVHEYIYPNVGERKQLEALVGHSGYIYKTEEDKKKHFERNTQLLQKMEKEEPDQLSWKVQQIQEYMHICAWDELETYCKNTIHSFEGKKAIVRISDVAQVYIGYMQALICNGKYEEALKIYKKCLKLVDKLFYLRAFTRVMASEAYYRLENYELLYETASEYLEAYQEYNENMSKYEVEEIGNIFTETFTPKMYHAMNTYMLLAKLELEDTKNLRDYYVELYWETPNQRILYLIHTKLFEVLVSLKEYDFLEMVVKRSLVAEHLKEQIKKRILIYRYEDKEIFSVLMNIIKNIDIWQWYKLYAEILTQGSGRDAQEIRDIAIEFVESTPNVFQIPNMIREQFARCGVELEALYTELDFMTWKTQLAEHFECMNMEQLEILKGTLSNSSLNTDVRYFYFMMLYSEQKIRQSLEQDMHMDTYSQLLEMFSYYTCKTYETLYGAEIQNMEPEQLPGNYQAALWLQIYFEEAESNLKSALACLGKVAEVYPMFSGVIRNYLECIQREIFE